LSATETTETAEPTGTPSTRIITVTDAASAKIADLLSQEPDGDKLALRVAVRPGGCSGFSYEMFFDADIADDDNLDNVTDAVRVVIDMSSAQMLLGATLDYSDGLQGAGFHIENPNASKSCGCGNSFS
jgi:iron-sulfur cluster assembly protein/iron-sulfur cluster insertion protein